MITIYFTCNVPLLWYRLFSISVIIQWLCICIRLAEGIQIVIYFPDIDVSYNDCFWFGGRRERTMYIFMWKVHWFYVDIHTVYICIYNILTCMYKHTCGYYGMPEDRQSTSQLRDKAILSGIDREIETQHIGFSLGRDTSRRRILLYTEIRFTPIIYTNIPNMSLNREREIRHLSRWYWTTRHFRCRSISLALLQ